MIVGWQFENNLNDPFGDAIGIKTSFINILQVYHNNYYLSIDLILLITLTIAVIMDSTWYNVITFYIRALNCIAIILIYIQLFVHFVNYVFDSIVRQ